MGEYPWRRQALCSLPAVSLVALLWLATGPDRKTADFFESYRTDRKTLTAVMQTATDWGNYLLYSVYAVFLFSGIGTKGGNPMKLALAFLIAFAVTMTATYVMKGTIGRSRPYLDPAFTPLNWTDDFHSFPSGHTTEALLSTIPLAMYFRSRSLAIALGLAAALIAFTRIYLGMHYLSDVAGGIVLGNCGGAFAWLLYARHSRDRGGKTLTISQKPEKI